MTDIQAEVDARVLELQKLYDDTCKLVCGYSYDAFINSLEGELHALTVRANGIMRANGGHLDNDAIRIELLALRCVIEQSKGKR